MTPRDEFYVGYLATPPALERRLRRLAMAALLLAGPAGILLAWAHTPGPGGRFEYGRPVTVRGTLEWRPTPALRIADSGEVRRVPLVAQGKHGVTGLDTLDGRTVTMAVTRIVRGRDEMFEVAALPTAVEGAPLPAAVVEALGRVTLRGEVIDGKCDLGVMNPGDGPLHRGCAVRCLSGGVPAMLLLRDRDGQEARVALAGRDSPLPPALARTYAGSVVELEGTLVRRDGAPILLVDRIDGRALP